jgi:hypothetical protein
MVASISPSTFGHALAPFRSLNEALYSNPSAASRAEGTAHRGIPTTDAECDRILAFGEATAIRGDVAVYFAGFLGASSRVWTTTRRERLRALIARVGLEAVNASLIAVARAPREEVMDEAADTLVRAAVVDFDVVPTLADRLISFALKSRAETDDPLIAGHSSVRATITRALGRTRGQRTREKRISALACALRDPTAEVRDAAIQALGASGDTAARRLLVAHRPEEREPFLVEAIDDALAELGAL